MVSLSPDPLPLTPLPGTLLETLRNSRPFEELFRYATSMGVSRMDLLRLVHNQMDHAPEQVQKVMSGFLEETRGELWDSEEDLVAHYRDDENYGRLFRGEVGGNLIYKYKSMSLAFAAEPWIFFLADACKGIAAERLETPDAIAAAKEQIDRLAEFCHKKLASLLDVHGNVEPLHMESDYDVAGWLQSKERGGLCLLTEQRLRGLIRVLLLALKHVR